MAGEPADEDDQDELGRGGLTIERRVDLLERDSGRHARSITALVQAQAAHGKEIDALGEWRMSRLLAEAREEERQKSLLDRLERIDASILGTKGDIKSMRDVWTRILWIVAGVVIPAAIAGIALVLVYGAAALRPVGGP